MRRALSIDERSHGPEHPAVARDLNNLALLLQATNRLGEAEPLMRRALAIDEKSFGLEHPNVARNLTNLAYLLQTTNRHADAEPLYRRALAIFEKSLGPEHPNVAVSLNNLAHLLQDTNRRGEAEPLMRRALTIKEKSFGPEHPEVAIGLNNLSTLLQKTNRLGEAEPLMRRALAIDEMSYGPDHPKVATSLNNLAQMLKDTNRLGEAEPLMRRALAIDEKSYGPEHPEVAADLNNLAALLRHTNRLAEAEPLFRRALAIDEKSYGPEHPSVARDLNNLANLLQDTNQLAAAEPLMRRALAIGEKSFGPEHPDVANRLSNLAQLLQGTNRRGEAEPLMRRALAIDEKSYGPEHPEVATNLNNLAHLLHVTNRLAEAEPLYQRALTIDEKSYGPEHPIVAIRLSNLAGLLQDTNRLADAELLHRRALAIGEKSFGPEHPDVATRLNNLAQLLKATDRLGEAEPLMRRALAIFEKSHGPGHPHVSAVLDNLAFIRAELGDWMEAARLHGRARSAMTAARSGDEGGDRSGLAKAVVRANTGALRAAARAVHRAAPSSAKAREESFELAQGALQTAAADALSQMSVRFAKGAGPLAQVVRERQNLLTQRQSEDRLLLAAVGKADAKGAEAMRTAITGLDAKLDAIDKRLAREFPDYARFANPKPLTISATQALLKPNEALLVFLHLPRFGKLPGETLAWVSTRTEARWISIPLGTASLRERVATLRCGLDREGLWSWDGLRWVATGERCRALRPDGLGADETLPFDLGFAHELYWALLAPFADLIKGKSLIIVPSGPLTSLPFHVLVTHPPTPNPSPQGGREHVVQGEKEVPDPRRLAAVPAPAAPDYRKAKWLALEQPVTVLPSVGSLQALRKLAPSQAQEPYIAFGNPLLDGGAADRERAMQARAKQTCPQDLESPRLRVATAAKGAPGLSTLFRGGIDLASLRTQAPLPETADELCAVAKALGASGREADTVWLGATGDGVKPQGAFPRGQARARVRAALCHSRPAGGRERSNPEGQGRAGAAAHPAKGRCHRRRPGAGRRSPHRFRGGTAGTRRRLGGALSLQHRGWREGGCRGVVRPGARLLLRQGPRAPGLALVRRFRCGGETHHRDFRGAQGQPQNRPRRGAAPFHGTAD